MSERAITAAITRFLKTVPGCFAWKEHGGMYGTAGLPDVICCINGRFIAFEVKTPSGKLTKLQETTMRKIKDAGGEAFKVTALQEVKEIVKNLKS
jgi:Holliday junction resolvase